MKIKLKQLEEGLENVLEFQNPKLHFEQYSTPPHISAHLLHQIQMEYGDIENKIICDLGCGTGTLSIGASMLGANFILGVDIDVDALNIFDVNKQSFDIVNIETILLDINRMDIQSSSYFFRYKFDVVIMNPPFGTKDFLNIELAFLQLALNISTSSVYSLMTADHIDKINRFCKKQQIQMQNVSDIIYNLDRTYAKHKHNSKDICVKLLRFTKCINKNIKLTKK